MALPHEPDAHRYSNGYLKNRCCEAVAHWIEMATSLPGTENVRLTMPLVEFNLRGLNAGMACVAENGKVHRIRINADLLRRYPREMIQHTVPHEVAHLVTYAICGKMDHGREWRRVMKHFGKPPTRCHQMKAQPARRHSKYTYRCDCREHVVGPQINARIRRGQTYMCRRCSTPLRNAA